MPRFMRAVKCSADHLDEELLDQGEQASVCQHGAADGTPCNLPRTVLSSFEAGGAPKVNPWRGVPKTARFV